MEYDTSGTDEDTEYRVKTVAVRDNKATETLVMVVKMDVGDNKALGLSGFGGEHHMFVVKDARGFGADYDAHRLVRRTDLDTLNDAAAEFIIGLHHSQILWDEFDDGDVLTPKDVAYMMPDGSSELDV